MTMNLIDTAAASVTTKIDTTLSSPISQPYLPFRYLSHPVLHLELPLYLLALRHLLLKLPPQNVQYPSRPQPGKVARHEIDMIVILQAQSVLSKEHETRLRLRTRTFVVEFGPDQVRGMDDHRTPAF